MVKANISTVYVLSVSVSDFSNEIASVCQLVVFSVVGQTIDIFGIGANIINVICFVKQGFKDSVNVSLLGLALADLGCLATLIWTNICYIPAFIAADLPFDYDEVPYLTSGLPHTTFTRVTAWITATITIERLLCIIAPLKVKRIVTPKRVAVIVACIFIGLLPSVAPMYIVNTLGMKYNPRRNKTLLGLVPVGDRAGVEEISFAINNVLVPFIAFIVVTFCTACLVVQLRKITKWRETEAGVAPRSDISGRNQKIAKMVVMISTLFIICFIPLCFIFLTIVLEPEFSIDGKYRNSMILCGGFGFILESINSSVNIFIYYYMSSKYKETFHKLFVCNVCHYLNKNRT